MSGESLYNKYRKAHGPIIVPSPHPALHGDTMEELPDFHRLPAQQQIGWTEAARPAKKTKKK